jgi:hypothetical protein
MIVVPRHAYPYTLRAVPWDADTRLKRAGGQVGPCGRANVRQTVPGLLTPAMAAPAREHEWAAVGAPLRTRPVHLISWEYDL